MRSLHPRPAADHHGPDVPGRAHRQRLNGSEGVDQELRQPDPDARRRGSRVQEPEHRQRPARPGCTLICQNMEHRPSVPPSADIRELTGGLAGRAPRMWGHDAIDRWTATDAIIKAEGLDPKRGASARPARATAASRRTRASEPRRRSGSRPSRRWAKAGDSGRRSPKAPRSVPCSPRPASWPRG